MKNIASAIIIIGFSLSSASFASTFCANDQLGIQLSIDTQYTGTLKVRNTNEIIQDYELEFKPSLSQVDLDSIGCMNPGPFILSQAINAPEGVSVEVYNSGGWAILEYAKIKTPELSDPVTTYCHTIHSENTGIR